MSINPGQPLRAAQYAEHILVTSILEGTYPPGAPLPSERALAKQIGVTRATLRETLQRLASEGWMTIQHGKLTVMNDYWKEGGLRLLSTMARYAEFLPEGFVVNLLEVRAVFLPAIARRAVQHAPEVFLDYLGRAEDLGDEAEAFVNYDWELQVLMARHSRNPIWPLILNDFDYIFKIMALRYFSRQEARDVSRAYYLELSRAIDQGGEEVERVVRFVMETSIELWKELKASQGDKQD